MISLPTFRGVLSSFSPLSLAPALWVTDNGSDPSVWTDMSGNGRHAVQATGANQPSIVTNVINGRQVRRFNGTTTRLTPPDFNLDNHTIFAVAIPDSPNTAVAETVFSIGSNVNGSRDVILYNTTNSGVTTFEIQRSNNILYPTAKATTTNLVKQIVVGKYDGSQLTIYVNNGARNSVAANNIGTSQNKPIIGATLEANIIKYLYKGDIAEIIAYPSNLSYFNCLQVERYLSKKYNIAIA